MHKRWKTALIAVAAAGLFAGCGDEGDHKPPNAKTEDGRPQIKVTAGAVKMDKTREVSKENSGQFYYSYNKEKGAEEEAPKTRTTIDAYLNIRSPYERVRITMMIKRLSKDFIIRCSPCHDDYANGVIGPSLLDKDGDFIYGRLIDFKTGKRDNVLMKELVMQIDDAKLKSIADEIATFNKQIRKMREERK